MRPIAEVGISLDRRNAAAEEPGSLSELVRAERPTSIAYAQATVK